MQNLIVNILVIFLGYILGSIPWAYIVGRFRGFDVKKEIVDGARGASFTWRKIGRLYGFIVGSMDALKGFFAVFLAQKISGQPIVIVLTGLAAIIGHNWSLFLNFTGGRGAATTGGALFYVLPREFSISAAVVISLMLLFVKKKSYFKLPFSKKEFKTSDFFSAVFFGFLLVITTIFNGLSLFSFSPLLFSGPMVVKAFTLSPEAKELAKKEILKSNKNKLK